MGSGLSTQNRGQQCSQCQKATEFFCITCKCNLCLQCKDIHASPLGTKHHDVIYQEKDKYILKEEICLRHPERVSKKYCSLCKLPLCSECKKHQQHEIHDIRTAYKINREQHRDIIRKIRSENLYDSRVLLNIIKIDLKTEQINIINLRNIKLKMPRKAQGLKELIAIVMCDVKVKCFKVNHKLQQRKRTLASMEIYEHGYEQSANRAVKFLFFLKNTFVPNIKETLHINKNALLSLPMNITMTENINKENVIELLSEIQITERGKRQVRLPELMSTPVLQKMVNLKMSGDVTHISMLTSDMFWISLRQNFFTVLNLVNIGEDIMNPPTSSVTYSWYNLYGAHTVNNKGELIYKNGSNSIIKLLTENRTGSTLIKGTNTWELVCVYSSPSNGDLLVGMLRYVDKKGMVIRYNKTGDLIRTIQHDNKGQQLYSEPKYITENHNKDVIVSDSNQLVVTDNVGKHRFSYTGFPSESRLEPYGICTDVLSNILFCDGHTNTVHIIDKDGHFLSWIPTQEQGIMKPYSLCYDNETQTLWVGTLEENKLGAYRYLE